MDRTVGAELGISSYGGCELELQVAVARTPGLTVTETLSIVHEWAGEITPVEVATPHDGRLHLVTLPPGFTRVTYEAQVRGDAIVPEPTLSDLSLYRRPSRYIESDTFGGFAVSEFAHVSDGELLEAVSSWVGTRLIYVPGSSGPTDGATETLLGGAGVCRDYAHLVIALLRALRVPARLAAVYAPGCDPMDFHAVVEAYVSGGWYVVDATALAPRSSLVRIATGRDAADTAFMTTVSGGVNLDWSTVTAVADHGLPWDDLNQLVALR
jgi:transglutaminase-like putative cysteine protease